MLCGGISLNSTILSCFIQGVPFLVRFPRLPPYPGNRASFTEINAKIQIGLSGQQLLLCTFSNQVSDEVGPHLNGDPASAVEWEGSGGNAEAETTFQGFRSKFLSRGAGPDHSFPLTPVTYMKQ